MRSSKTSLAFGALTLAIACGGNLDVGNGPGGSTNDSGISGSGSCKATDCANYAITCSSGQPTNLQCAYDNAISGCSLTGQCADTSAAQTCTFTPTPCASNGAPCTSSSGASSGGEIDLVSDPETPATTLTVNLATMTAQTIGSCVFQPYGQGSPGYVNGQPWFNEGTVTATAPGFTLSAPALCDGSYPVASTSQLVDQGAVVSFKWVGVKDEPPPIFPTIPGPHAISVGASVLAGATLPRASDVALSWTQLGTPLSLEQVGFELVQGQSRLECRFPSSDDAGTVPADALLQFASGSAQFRMFSLHTSTATANIPMPTFIVMRQATFSSGPAVKGSVTLQ